MYDGQLTLIVQCNVSEAELDLRHIIAQESHLDRSHTRYLGQSYAEGPSRFPRVSRYCYKLEKQYMLTCNVSSYCVC